MTDLCDNERALFAVHDAAHDLAVHSRTLAHSNGGDRPAALDQATNTLMTALWDQGFSQTEIRNAYEAALADMNRYAAGEEQRF